MRVTLTKKQNRSANRLRGVNSLFCESGIDDAFDGATEYNYILTFSDERPAHNEYHTIIKHFYFYRLDSHTFHDILWSEASDFLHERFKGKKIYVTCEVLS